MRTLLSTYMKREGVTDSTMALAIGKDRSLVTRLRHGSIRPTIEVAGAIERETCGEVTMQSWLMPTPEPADLARGA